jgi:hypothetical protein
MLIWPVVAVLGFVVLATVVVALAASSTAQYEFERNRVRQQATVPVPVDENRVAAVRPAEDQLLAVGAVAAQSESGVEHAATLGGGGHPAGTRVVERGATPAWWLVEACGQLGEQVVAGPFSDRLEADWAALAEGAERRPVFGAVRADGGMTRAQSAEERAWLGELGDQLDRLPEDWDEGLSDDDDALVTLVVEVAAALVEAGLTVHDCAGQSTAGGVCLTPELGRSGVLVSWHQHDRMSRDQVRGAAIDAAVQQTMNVAIGDCLRQMGFELEPFGSSGCSLVTAAQAWW